MIQFTFYRGSEFTLRQLTCVLFCAGLLCTSGCLTVYSNTNHDPDLGADHVLNRRYVLTSDAKFAIVKVHWFPLGFGHPTRYRELALPRGATVQIQHIQTARGNGIDGDDFFDCQYQAIVLTGPCQGERIDAGNVFIGYVRCQSLAPLPNDQPAWLDTASIPPRTRPISTTDLALAAHDPDWASRYYAVQELARRSPTDSEAIAPLVAEINDNVAEVRVAATDGLGRAGSAAIAAVDSLLIRLRGLTAGRDFFELDRTEHALADVGPVGYAKVATLLASTDRQVVEKAAEALAYAPKGAAKAQVPALEAALRRDPRWRESMGWSPIMTAIVVADRAAAERITQ